MNKTKSLSDELYGLEKEAQIISQQLIKKVFQTVISPMGEKTSSNVGLPEGSHYKEGSCYSPL